MTDARLARDEQVRNLGAEFAKQYGSKPEYVAVSPGRVNIIGEHIDYMGFSVLPCAINQTTAVAISAAKTSGGPFLEIRSVDENYAPIVFPKLEDVALDKSVPANVGWTRYALAAFFGLIEFVVTKDASQCGNVIRSRPTTEMLQKFTDACSGVPSGIKLLVCGTVPEAAGLSSSSALTVGLVMAFQSLLKLKVVDTVQLAEICIGGERHCGTCSGGMDQSAILFSKAAFCQLISFGPLSSRLVKLPSSARFVVTNTFVKGEKSVSAATHYNRRVFECRVAIIAMSHCIKNPVPLQKISEIDLKKFMTMNSLTSYDEVLKIAHQFLHREPYTLDEIEKLLTKEELSALLSSPIGSLVWNRNPNFHLWTRVEHVLREAGRVEEFVRECETGSSVKDETLLLQKLGALMDASDLSLNCLFDCSCPEIVHVTRLARKLGAYGSRLTGAGWGGCVVSLIDASNESNFCTKMQEYYTDEVVQASSNPKITDRNSRIFTVAPADGAVVFPADV